MKRIKKQVLSTMLAISMGFSLIPQNVLNITAFAGNETAGDISMKTDGTYRTYVGSDSDPSFKSDVIGLANANGLYSTGLSYGSMDTVGGDLIFWHVQVQSTEDDADYNYNVFDRRAMYCVDKHVGDLGRNTFNNGFSKGILKMTGDGELVNTITGEDASPVHAGNQKFTTAFLIACLGYKSDLSKITDSRGYMNFSAAVPYYYDFVNIRTMLWALATEDTGLTGDWLVDFAAYKANCGKSGAYEQGECTDAMAKAMGCVTGADEQFYKCWKAAKLNYDMSFNDGAMEKKAASSTTNEDGSTTNVYKFDKDLVKAGLASEFNVSVEGGTYSWDLENGTLTVTCPAGTEVSGTVTATGLSWDGNLGSSVPNFATADIGRFYYASIDPDIDEDSTDILNNVNFSYSQNYMSVVFNGEYTFTFGKVASSDTTVEVKRYKHEEQWNADYNVRLAKFDSETGKALQGSHFDILEKFDDSQLNNTHLEYSYNDVQGGASSGGSLIATEWGDDEVADNWSGDTGVLVTDDNYRNWDNDTNEGDVTFKSQFKKWDDPENDPCKKDDEITGDDGFLQTNGSGSPDTAHNDSRTYKYKKGYCGGHPAPEIDYVDGDDEDVDEINQKLHDDAWEAWAEEVAKCEELANEGGFFHAIDEGAAKEALEEDRDQFYKDFTSLTYEYSAVETQARTGYILHDIHTDDIPIEWRTVTSSQYKDWTERGELQHTDSTDGSDEDEDDEDIDEYSLNTANYIVDDDSIYSASTVSDIIPIGTPDENTANAYEIAVANYFDDSDDEEYEDLDEEGVEDEKLEEVESATKSNIKKAKRKASTSNVDMTDGENPVESKNTEFSIRAIFNNIKNFFSNGINAVSNFLGVDDDDKDAEGGNGEGQLYVTEVTEPSEANEIDPDESKIVDWTFIVYDHRTEGELHINKKDFNLKNDESDDYDAYADENGDGTLEGAVYGLFAQNDIYHPDGKTGIVFKAGDLVAIATTDRNGDTSFMTITEAPGTHYNYETGSTEHTDWYDAAPKNLHTNEADSAVFSDDIEVFKGHDPDNAEITAGNGEQLPDTETADGRTYFWKNSTNQEYDSGKLADNEVTNRKEDTYRDKDTSGHYPISNNEDNNGNCWIGRPIIVSGEHVASYYVKELSRSEGYELSVNGKDADWTNRYAELDSTETHPTVEASSITAGDFATGMSKYNEFTITSTGTNNYHVKLENIYNTPTLYAVSSKTVWDPDAPSGEVTYETTTKPVYGTVNQAVLINGQRVEAKIGDIVNLPNGETATVQRVSSTDPLTLTVSPTNALITALPTITADDQSLEVTDDNLDALLKEYNKKLMQQSVGMSASTAQATPYFLVELTGTTYQNYFDKINAAIGSQKLFNNFYLDRIVNANGKRYVMVRYRYAEGNTAATILYDEDNEKIYRKTSISYKDGEAAQTGFVYVPYEKGEYEVLENVDGFVTKAKLQEKKPSKSVIEIPSDMTGLTFESALQHSYWVYAENEQARNDDGSLKVQTIQTAIPQYGAYVTKETNEKVNITKTGDKTYEFDYTTPDDGDNKIVFRMAYDNDYYNNQAVYKLVENKGHITVTVSSENSESYVLYDNTLQYPGQETIVQDNGTAVTPASVEERPIRQQVKISKDVETLPETLEVWYCANDGTENSVDTDTCAGCGRKRTVEATKYIDFAHDTYTQFFNEDLSDHKQETNWIERVKTWFKTIAGIKGSEDTSKAVANFRFKAYLKSNLERLYRDENGKVTWVDRNGNEVTPNYKDTNGDGLYETFTWNTYNGTSDFPEKDKVSDENGILSANVQKIYTAVDHLTTSHMTSAIANNVWNSYGNPETGATSDVAERNNAANTNERDVAGRSDDAITTNISLYSYEDDNTNVLESDRIRENQNNGYTRVLESTESVIEDGAGKTRIIHAYNYEKFFDAISAANTDKWDGNIETCTFNYDGYDTPVGKVSMWNYPGQHWEETLESENQKGDEDNSFDLFRWIHEKIYGSIEDYRDYKGTLNGENVETTTSTSDYARANAEASNAVRQFAVKWYLQDEVAKLVKNNGVGDGEDIAKTEAEGGAPGITEEGVVPYDDYVHDYALFKALQKAYNYLRPFYENDLDTIYSVEWDSAANGGNDKDVTTLSVDNHENGAFYNASAYLPYGTYVVVEQTPTNFSADTGYDLVNRAFNIEKPKEVLVPSLYDAESTNNTTDNYDTKYNLDTAMSVNDQAKASNYLIRFNEEWRSDDQSAVGTAEHVIRAHNFYGDYEVFKYGLDVDKIGKETGSSIMDNGGYDFRGFTIAQSVFDPLKDYYSVGHNGESKNGTMTKITASEGGEGANEVRYPLRDITINNEMTANGSSEYDVDDLINRFFYASVSEDSGTANGVIYKGAETDDNNVSGMYFKDGVKSLTGELTAYEGKYAQMLVPWTVTAPADKDSYSSVDFSGYADVNERNTFKPATLTIRKVDAETGEQILHDDSVFAIYAASRYTTEDEIKKDSEKLTGDERTKFLNQFKPGDTKFYLENTKVYASKEFLEAMGAYDISYLLTLSENKAKRYQENGYDIVSESEIKNILGENGYTKITGTIEYGIYHYDILDGTSIPDDEEVTWYYSVYNTDSPMCVGIIPKGTPICSEKNAVILQDDFGNRTGMLKAYSTLNDVLMEDEDKAGTTSYHLQNTGYIRTPQPLGSGCYVVAELKTPAGYLRGKPEAHEIYSGVDYYYESGDMFKKAAAVDYAKRIDQSYSYGTK